jgi:hypothetical protein
MYSHGYNWREEPEGTSLASIVLLLIFVGAVAFIGAMVYFRPWDDKPATVTEVLEPAGSPAPEAVAPAAPEAIPPATQ